MQLLKNLEGFDMSFRKLVLAAFFVALAGGVSGQDPDYVLTISDGTVAVGGSGSITMGMDSTGADIQGWSYGACNDTAFITCTSVEDGSTTATVNNGGPPGFNEVSVNDEGFTVGVVICFTGCAVLPPGSGYELNVATYTGNAEGTTEVSYCGSLGSPPVDTVVVVNGQSLSPTQTSGFVDVVGVVAHIRGDANGDQRVNIADGIWIISELFLGGPASTCPIARNANGDSSVDAADAVFIFNYRFSDGPQPSAPFPDCGLTDSQTPADCSSSGC